MKLTRALAPVAVLLALAMAGLFAGGTLGAIGAFTWLGVFPGLALVRLVLPGAGTTTRWTLGVALAPIVSALAGLALMSAGQPLPMAARLVAIAGWILFASGEARATVARAQDPDDAPAASAAWAWALAGAAVVALPPLVNAWDRIRSDTWVHVGIVWEIALRGVPPQDPRFAGLPLNYVWIYNLFLAQLQSLHGHDPFTLVAIANVAWMGAQVWLGWSLAWMLWRDRASARGALPLLVVGLNAGALALWPLWLARALHGTVRGWAEVRRVLADAHWGTVDVIHQLNAPFSWMLNPWDKFTLGTALGYAYLLLLVYLWAGLRWLRAGADRPAGAFHPARWLVIAALAAAGMVFVHSVVGLSAVPSALGACALAALLAARRGDRPGAARAVALGVATLVGLAIALPYFRAIALGWDPRRSGVAPHYFHVGFKMAWTAATACGVAAAFAWAPMRRALRARDAAAGWLAAWLAGMLAFVLFVHLPEGNEHKFVPMAFVPLALFGGAAWSEGLARARARLGAPLFTAAFALAFVAPTALFLYGYLADPSGRTSEALHATADIARMNAWVRDSTDVRAVFVDHASRDLLLVTGRRRLLCGTPFGPERAAFPLDALRERRRVEGDLYGPVAALDRDVRTLAALGAPVYVLYRLGDDYGGLAPWSALERDPRFALAFANPGARAYRLAVP